MLFCAIVNAVQEIGEAARCVSEPSRAKLPGVPWPQVVGIRHVFVHVYWGINPGKLWDTATLDIPLLIAKLEEGLRDWPLPID